MIRNNNMALSVGTEAPDFTLLDTDKNPVNLSSFRGKRVVLAFFPAAFSGVCDNEMCTFQESLTRLNDANAVVLGISADLPFSNKVFKAKNNLEFPILSDWSMATTTAYDVVFDNFAGIQGLQRAARSVYVLDESGVIQYVEVTANPGVEPDYEAAYTAVEALG
jgi:glutaredoxin-dependent peroxiredoxin